RGLSANSPIEPPHRAQTARRGPRGARRTALVTADGSAPDGAGSPNAAAALGCRGAPFADTRSRLASLAPPASSGGNFMAVCTIFWADTKVAESSRATVSLNCHNPMTAQVERQFLVQTFDERRTVLVQEPHEPDSAFLRVTVWKGERACVDELSPQRFVTPLGRLDHFRVQRLEIMLHTAERCPRRAFERRIERRNRLDHPRHP